MNSVLFAETIKTIPCDSEHGILFTKIPTDYVLSVVPENIKYDPMSHRHSDRQLNENASKYMSKHLTGF